MFSSWYQGMPAGVEVCPIQPPGRENRLGEPPITRISRLVPLLHEALSPLLDLPFAFFGYSVGSLTAFELARRLRQQGPQPPEWLFVSGHPSPDLPQRRPPVSHLPPPEFWQAMRDHFDMDRVVLENEDLKELLYSPLRADYELVETYVYQEEPPFDFPLSVFGGAKDLETTEAELLAWGKHTTGRFRSRILEGNHLFIKTAREALVRDISQDLTPLLATGAMKP